MAIDPQTVRWCTCPATRHGVRHERGNHDKCVHNFYRRLPPLFLAERGGLTTDFSGDSSKRQKGVLSARHRLVLQLLADGVDRTEIASKLGVVVGVVSSYTRDVADAWGVEHRPEYLVALAMRLKVIS